MLEILAKFNFDTTKDSKEMTKSVTSIMEQYLW